MSNKDPNDGIDCQESGKNLYNAKRALEAAQTAVESASRELGIAERARDALQHEYDSIEGAARTATYLAELHDRIVDATTVVGNRHSDVVAAVNTSNEAGSEVARQQHAFDYYCS